MTLQSIWQDQESPFKGKPKSEANYFLISRGFWPKNRYNRDRELTSVKQKARRRKLKIIRTAVFSFARVKGNWQE